MTSSVKLLGIHSLSETNLMFAEKLGGIPSPSLAVIRNDTIPDKGSFGEISLIAPPSMVDPDNTAVFNSDIYSIRQPRANYDVNHDEYRGLIADIDNELKGTGIISGNYDQIIETGGMDKLVSEAKHDIALKYLYILDQDIEVVIPREEYEPRVSVSKQEEVQIAFSDPYISTLDYRTEEMAQLGRVLDKAALNEAEEFADRFTKDIVDSKEREQAFKEETAYWYEAFSNKLLTSPDAEGNRYPGVSTFNEIQSDLREMEGLDPVNKDQLRRQLDEEINGSDRYEEWVGELFGTSVGEAYFSYLKDDDYVRENYTLEALSDYMGGQYRDTESYQYGVGNIRAVIAREYESIEEMVSDALTIVSKEEMKEVKEENDNAFFQLAEDMRFNYRYAAATSSSPGYLNEVVDIVKSYASKGASELSEWLESPEDNIDDLRLYVKQLEASPTEYFEAKIDGALSIGDFSSAVVPKGISREALDVLVDAGIKQIETYDKDIPGDRLRAVNRFQDSMFGSGPDWSEDSLSLLESAIQKVRSEQSAPTIDL